MDGRPVKLKGHHVDGAEISVTASAGLVVRLALVHTARSTVLDLILASVALVEAAVVSVVKAVVRTLEMVCGIYGMVNAYI